MPKPTVAYATFCCAKDMERAHEMFVEHLRSHRYAFDQVFFVHQRCTPIKNIIEYGDCKIVLPTLIKAEDYPKILSDYGVKYPDPVLDKLTHGWGAPHFWAHHMVNHLRAAQLASADYIVFADADCYIKESPEGHDWVTEGIRILEDNPDTIFVVSPNDGGDGRLERIMSQQMFLISRKWFMGMEFIPWDETFIEGGPFQEYYGLLEGWIARYMSKHSLYRYVLGADYRYWHKEWH